MAGAPSHVVLKLAGATNRATADEAQRAADWVRHRAQRDADGRSGESELGSTGGGGRKLAGEPSQRRRPHPRSLGARPRRWRHDAPHSDTQRGHDNAARVDLHGSRAQWVTRSQRIIPDAFRRKTAACGDEHSMTSEQSGGEQPSRRPKDARTPPLSPNGATGAGPIVVSDAHNDAPVPLVPGRAEVVTLMPVPRSLRLGRDQEVTAIRPATCPARPA